MTIEIPTLSWVLPLTIFVTGLWFLVLRWLGDKLQERIRRRWQRQFIAEWESRFGALTDEERQKAEIKWTQQ